MKITNCNLLCFSWDRSASLWLQVRDWKTLHHVKNYSYTSTPESWDTNVICAVYLHIVGFIIS